MSLAVSQFASVRISAKPVARRNAPARMTVRAAGGGGKGGEEGGRAFGNDAFGMVAKNANYGLFAAAITKTGCEGIMTGPGPITVFCPNDDAFVELAQKLGTTKMDLMSHQALPNIVKHHVVQGAVTLADMSEGKVFTTMGGTQLKCSGGKVNGMSFKKNDIKVGNGIVHAVNGVIPSQ